MAVSSLDNQYYPDLVQRLSEEFAKRGYRLLLFITHGSAGPDPLVDELLRYRLDALVLASSTVSSALATECRVAGVPVLMFNNIDPASDVASMAPNNELGARTVAAFMVAAGHRSFGYVGGIEGDSSTFERESAFSKYLRKQGLPAPVAAYGDFSFSGAVQTTRSLLRRSIPPDALFCTNDHLALAAVQVAQFEYGLQPGKDISIVGFDNAPVSSWPCFGLTTYSQPMTPIVNRIVKIICAMIENESGVDVHEKILGELIVRTSARLPERGLFKLANGDTSWRPSK